jgi:hypothetical protein
MTTEREMERLVRSWLEPGLTALTDDVLDSVMDQLPATPQRRASWSPRRLRGLRAVAGFSLAAAAVLVVAIVGFTMAPRPFLPGVEDSPTPAPSSGCRELDGPYRAMLGTTVVRGSAPNGWIGLEDAFNLRLENKPCGQAGTARLEISLVAGVYPDACERRDAVVSAVTPGSMVTALDGQRGHQPAERTDTTLGGYPATRFTFTADADTAACTFGTLGLWRSRGGTDTNVEPGDVVTVYVVDVDGQPLAVAASRCCPDELPALESDLTGLIGSLQFEATEGTPLASPAGSASPLRLPGTRASAAGVYGWEGGPGSSSIPMMHKVIGEGDDVREATALIFRVGANCLGSVDDLSVEPVHIAGFDGVVVERYEPPVTFGPPQGVEITRAHALAIGDRTLCAFVTWQPSTTEAELDAAIRVLDTIRAEPIGDDRIRIRFTLDAGWDTG